MPVNIKYPLADVMRAAAEFDRRVTFEYVMLGGVNDGAGTRGSSPRSRASVARS
jgi:adenine C2-methylase RlmN of 23S rRNA A2503 and tRNA A37